MSNITVIPLKKPRMLMADPQPSNSLEASLRQQFQNKKRLNGAADSKATRKRKKTQKKSSKSAPLTQGQIGEAEPVRYKRKGGYWWSKANVDDDEVEDDLIAQAKSTSNHQLKNINSVQFPHLSWDSVPINEPGANEAPSTSHEIKQEELEFDEELEEKPSTAFDPAYAIPDASMNAVLKEEELDEAIGGSNIIAFTETQIKEEEPDYNEYNEEFYTDIKPELLDPSLVEVIDPKASNEPTEQSMRVEVKEEEVDYEGMVEIKEEGEEDEYEATEEYAEEEPDREMRKKSSREDEEARLKKEKRWRIYAALGEMPPKGRPSFNETTILKAKVLKKFGPKAKELFSLD